MSRGHVMEHLVKNAKYNLWLIHGYAESSACFNSIFTTSLAQEANIFIADLPGFGDVPLIKMGYQEYLKALVQQITTSYPHLPCVIVGHSLGGIIATEIASQLQENLSLLIVVDAALSANAAALVDKVNHYSDPE